MGTRLDFTIKVSNKLLLWLVVLELGFLLIFSLDAFLGPIQGIHNLFDMDREGNIPTWFSSTQLLVIGLLFLLLSYQDHTPYRLSPRFLLLLGVGFILLSLDETAAFHENITASFKEIKWLPRFKGNHGLWIPLYLSLGLAFTLLTYREIWAMWKHYRYEAFIFGLGAAILLMGAVGLEIISYRFLRRGFLAFLYPIEVGLEEFFEMLGGTILLYATILFASHKGSSSESQAETPEEIVRENPALLVP